MPKIIELTVELEVQKVSCPGVWLCQDGRVSLTVFALGTSYQTCLLPPAFPLLFKDKFYFRKRFQESCTLNNICCILREETIYCELVQWTQDCQTRECTVLAQYLGALNDVLFPPNICTTEGVDLLMRRTKEFPGILSPKIEIATKVRIDEVWDNQAIGKAAPAVSCECARELESSLRQKQVCHSAQYHRKKCHKRGSPTSRSRSRSGGSRSCCSLTPEPPPSCGCPKRCPPSPKKSRCSLGQSSRPRRRTYGVYNVRTDNTWPTYCDVSSDEDIRSSSNYNNMKSKSRLLDAEKFQKSIIESRYIEHDTALNRCNINFQKHYMSKINPCICEICRRYHELFHTEDKS